MQPHEQCVPFRSIVDGLDYNPTTVGALRSDGIDRSRHPVIGSDRRDLIKEAHAVGNVPEGAAGEGQVPFRVVFAKELLHHIGRPREPGDVVVGR